RMCGTEYFIPDLLDYRDPADRRRMRGLVGETSERWILQYALMLSQDFVVAPQEAGGPAEDDRLLRADGRPLRGDLAGRLLRPRRAPGGQRVRAVPAVGE